MTYTPEWEISFAFTGEEWQAEAIDLRDASIILTNARRAPHSAPHNPREIHDFIIIPLTGTTYVRRLVSDAEQRETVDVPPGSDGSGTDTERGMLQPER